MIRAVPVELDGVPRGTSLGLACPMVRPPVQKCGSLPQAGALPLSEQSATSEARETSWLRSCGGCDLATQTNLRQIVNDIADVIALVSDRNDAVRLGFNLVTSLA